MESKNIGEEMSNADYRKHEGISKSDLFKITKSPYHFKYWMDHKDEQEDTTALRFGRAVHKYILETDDFFNEFAIMPVFDRRTKDGKAQYEAWMNENASKDYVTEEEFETLKAMAEVVKNNKYASRLLKGEHEKSFFWVDEETGEACKCRPDCLTEVGEQHIIVDYKTTEDAELSAFMKSAIKYGYDLQAGMYCEGMKKNTGHDYIFVFVAQEKKPPFDINVLQVDEFFMKEGTELFHNLMNIYHECKTTGNWWGVMGKGGEVNSLGLPNWLRKEVE